MRALLLKLLGALFGGQFISNEDLAAASAEKKKLLEQIGQQGTATRKAVDDDEGKISTIVKEQAGVTQQIQTEETARKKIEIAITQAKSDESANESSIDRESTSDAFGSLHGSGKP